MIARAPAPGRRPRHDPPLWHATIRPGQRRQDLHRGRLARAVGPSSATTSPRPTSKQMSLQRDNRTERLADSPCDGEAHVGRQRRRLRVRDLSTTSTYRVGIRYLARPRAADDREIQADGIARSPTLSACARKSAPAVGPLESGAVPRQGSSRARHVRDAEVEVRRKPLRRSRPLIGVLTVRPGRCHLSWEPVGMAVVSHRLVDRRQALDRILDVGGEIAQRPAITLPPSASRSFRKFTGPSATSGVSGNASRSAR